MSFCIAGMPTKSQKLQPLCFQTGRLFFNVTALKPASLIVLDFLHCNWRHLSASYRVTPVRLKLIVDPQHKCIESGNGHNREPDHCGIMGNAVASWEVDQTLKRPTATAIHGCYMGERNQNFRNSQEKIIIIKASNCCLIIALRNSWKAWLSPCRNLCMMQRSMQRLKNVTVQAHRLIWLIMKRVHEAIHRPFIFTSTCH